MKKVLGFLFYTIVIAIAFFALAIYLSKSNDLASVLESIVYLIYFLPPIILIASIIYGIFRGFNLFIPIITALVAVLFMLYLNPESSINAEFFYIPLISAAISLVGNIIGRIFYRKKS